MTPEELEDLKTSDPERYEALTKPQRDQQQAADAKWRAAGFSAGASEHDPCMPTPYERQARAEREAARLAGDPEPPVYRSSGGW
ncbi:hypothetical protein DLJ47_01845 [Micromonospora sp. S4605]|uniref:hypothetical protein n=1 Tax=Micromonospora sp. S4605 TaxID=1420897 RepID=UPI000D6FF729|nr:hypothetical protein [Micromonospora sp. S4605]PWU57675.1 hypothetical protein DLJ47_01845 [Micromonospora sp. S4605]